ncbi:Vacuolar protein sorting-associated protein 5 [Meyerozyma sp. JA9]|nr:Vacuolar protein sorting-associated protein 5 [Meyerozyma sp. JA9]
MDSDDLTASHWDDILAPRENEFSGFGSTYVPPPVTNGFSDLMDTPFGVKKDSDSDEDEENDPENDHENGTNDEQNDHPALENTAAHHHGSFHLAHSGHSTQDPVQEQLNDIRHTHRAEQTSHLISELTQDLKESSLEAPEIVSPTRIDPKESLFADKGSPLRLKTAPDSPTKSPSASHVSPRRSSEIKQGHRLFTAPRPRKYSSKIVAKHLAEDSGDVEPLSADPLQASEDGNEKDAHSAKSNTRAEALVQQADAPLYDVAHTPLSPAKPEVSPTGQKTSKKEKPEPSLDITVGDPMKVGDIATAHIVYSIRTQVLDNPHFPPDSDSFTVSRRYKDFRWIYHQLQNNHPGKIIPPPPTKQTYIGRFNENFIEGRRLSLEKMLSRIAHVPQLRDDPDFVCFLSSDDFVRDAKERERLSGTSQLHDNDDHDDRGAGSRSDSVTDVGSAASSIGGSVVASASAVGTVGTGFMSLFSMNSKVDEPDSFFTDKKAYIDDLETNLKALYKSLDTIAAQRIDLVSLADEISNVSKELAAVEISKATSDLLAAFGDVHEKLRDNIDRVNLQDSLTLSFTIEEYLRIIGSINHVFDARSKIYQSCVSYKQELAKKQTQLEKTNQRSKSQQDKVGSLKFEVDKLQSRVTVTEKLFEQMSETFKDELENFEFERIDDFRNSVEIFIEGSIESQKESIELWETFYERQGLEAIGK